MGFGGSGSGSGNLSSSNDVSLNAVADSHLLAYDGSVSKWKNKAPTALHLPRVVTLTYASSVTPNADTSDIILLNLAGNTLFAVPSGTPSDGQKLELHLKQDSVGGRTVTWAGAYAFASGLPAPALSTTANTTDILGFRYSAAASKWRFYGIINGF
jgi:hypothetical protein